MKLTNNYGAPEVFLRAVRGHPYSKGDADFSVTGLLQPPQIGRLKNKHWEHLTSDMRDEVWKLLGSGVHAVLEQAPKCGNCNGTGKLPHEPGYSWVDDQITITWKKGTTVTKNLLMSLLSLLGRLISIILDEDDDPCPECDGSGEIDDGKLREQRFFSEYNGVKISGAVDLIDGTHLTDYKVSSVWTLKRTLNPNWEAQLNLYAWLFEQNGGEVDELTIVVICRDWTKSRADQDGYPDSPIVSLPVPLWSDSKREEFIAERVSAHTREDTVPCTNEERWARGAYEVKGPGRSKKFDTMEEAAAHINRQKTGTFHVVESEPTYIRCEGWCEVADFCPQWNGGTG